MEPKTGKKIVSKGAYVKTQIKKGFLWLKALCCLLTGFAILFKAVRVVHVLFSPRIDGLALFIYGVSCLFAAKKSVNQTRAMAHVVPLTRANTADLPAPDSLVRASEEPMQAQEAVLLRAAAQGMVTPPEQLVRAVNGRGERR